MPDDLGRPTTALILGKFCRHTAAIDTLPRRRAAKSDEVIVCLLADSAEPIPVDVRHASLQEIPWVVPRSLDGPSLV